MDKDLKEAVTYVTAIIICAATYIGVVVILTKDIKWIITSILFALIFFWLSYLQIQFNSFKGGKKNDKK